MLCEDFGGFSLCVCRNFWCSKAVVQASGIWRIVLPSKKAGCEADCTFLRAWNFAVLCQGTGLAGLSVSRGFGDIEYKTGTNAWNTDEHSTRIHRERA